LAEGLAAGTMMMPAGNQSGSEVYRPRRSGTGAIVMGPRAEQDNLRAMIEVRMNNHCICNLCDVWLKSPVCCANGLLILLLVLKEYCHLSF